MFGVFNIRVLHLNINNKIFRFGFTLFLYQGFYGSSRSEKVTIWKLITMIPLKFILLQSKPYQIKFYCQLRMMQWLLVNVSQLWFNTLLYGFLLILKQRVNLFSWTIDHGRLWKLCLTVSSKKRITHFWPV